MKTHIWYVPDMAAWAVQTCHELYRITSLVPQRLYVANRRSLAHAQDSNEVRIERKILEDDGALLVH